MRFRSYTNMVSQASRTVAAAVFVVGLMLIGFGVMIFLLPRFFATLAALVFFVVGLGCAVTGVRIFLGQRKLDRMGSDDSIAYRKNVHIRSDEYDGSPPDGL
jgi:hypothetical protein